MMCEKNMTMTKTYIYFQGNHGSAETLQGMSVCQVNRLSQCVLVRRRNMSRCLWVAAKELHSVLVVRRGDAQSVNQ